MSIETLLEAAKFVEWSAQLQQGTRDDSRAKNSKQTGPEQPPTKNPPHTVQRTVHTTPPPSHQHVPVSPKTASKPAMPAGGITHKPAGGITSPLPQEATRKSATHTSPRPLETSLVSNSPVAPNQAFPVALHRSESPQRAHTPPSAATNYTAVQYRPLAPVPAQSPNGSTQSFVAYHREARERYDSTASYQSDLDDGNSSEKGDDKKSDTREVHNKLEKNRRAHLKDCFDNLKAQVPNMEDKKIKTSNLSILQGALRYLQALKRKERELEHQLDKLARQKITYQQRLAKLKIEKRLTDDQLPWNRRHESEEEEMEVETAAREDDDDQASTSTASEAEEEERKSRANSPGLSPPHHAQLPLPQKRKRKKQSAQARNRARNAAPKMMHSVTKEIHSGPYVISRQIVTHMAQQRTETLPIISQLARKQAGKPIISAFEERRGAMTGMGNKNPYGPTPITTVNTAHSIGQSGGSIPVMTTQHVGLITQSGSRQTVSQLLGKQTPFIRAPALHAMPMAPSMPSTYTPVIRAPLRQPLTSVVYPAGSMVGVTTAMPPGVTIANKHVVTTSPMPVAASRQIGPTGVIYSSATTKSVIQPTFIGSSVTTTGGTALRTISPAIQSAQIQAPTNRVTIGNIGHPTTLPPRTIPPSFLSTLAMQPSALTQVLFTQPPVAAYSLAQTQLANPLIPSALHQTVIPPPVAVTTVTQSVITQIIPTLPVTTIGSGKATTITTPAIASMVPYPSLAALGVAPYTFGPPLALNKSLVTTTPAYTTLPLGSAAALQKLTMSQLPFHAPGTIPYTAGTAQTALLPLTGLRGLAVPRPPHVGMTTAPVAMPAAIPMTTPIAIPSSVVNTPAIRPRLPVDPRSLIPACTTSPVVAMTSVSQVPKSTGLRAVTPKTIGVKAPVGNKKDKKIQQGVTTSQMQQILASSRSVVTMPKPATATETKSMASTKQVAKTR